MNISLTIDLKSLILANMRSSYLADSLGLYLLIPMGVVGTLLNSFGLIIFSKLKCKNKSLFKYLKVYVACCFLIGFINIFGFFLSSFRFFDLANTYVARIFKCYFVSSVLGLLFFYSSVLDVFINLERALNFSDKYQRFKSISPNKICMVLLIICLIINIPNYMAQEIVPIEDLPFKLRYCIPTSFGSTSFGKILLTSSYIIQGPVVLILIIISNVWSVVSFRIFIKKKNALTNNSHAEINGKKIKKQKAIEKRDKNLLKMTVFLTLFAFVMLSIQFISQSLIFVFNNLFNNQTVGLIIFSYMFAMDLKQLTNIFFIYFFNKRFRRTVFKLLLRPKSSAIKNKPNSTTN